MSEKLPVVSADEFQPVVQRTPDRVAPHFNVHNFLSLILTYYDRTKGVGHTKCLFPRMGFIDGSEVRPIVVAHNETFGRVLSPSHHVGLTGITADWVYKHRAPLLWDNGALISIFMFAKQEIEAAREAWRREQDKSDDLEDSLESSNIENYRLTQKLQAEEAQNKKLKALVLKLHRVRMEAVGALAALEDEVMPEHPVFGLANETDEDLLKVLGIDYAEALKLALDAAESKEKTEGLLNSADQDKDNEQQDA